jgi:transcriptional regulator with XRE-family HTH domain
MKINTSNLKRLREERGYSQKQMAALLSMEQSTYSKHELGKTIMTFDQVFEIAKILECNIEKFAILPPALEKMLKGNTISKEEKETIMQRLEELEKLIKKAFLSLYVFIIPEQILQILCGV